MLQAPHTRRLKNKPCSSKLHVLLDYIEKAAGYKIFPLKFLCPNDLFLTQLHRAWGLRPGLFFLQYSPCSFLRKEEQPGQQLPLQSNSTGERERHFCHCQNSGPHWHHKRRNFSTGFWGHLQGVQRLGIQTGTSGSSGVSPFGALAHCRLAGLKKSRLQVAAGTCLLKVSPCFPNCELLAVFPSMRPKPQGHEARQILQSIHLPPAARQRPW